MSATRPWANTESQHALQGVARDADDLLHRVGHTLEDVEHDAWNGLQDGVHNVANAIDHVIDGLHLQGRPPRVTEEESDPQPGGP